MRYAGFKVGNLALAPWLAVVNVGALHCRGPFLSYVTRAIGENVGDSSMPPQGLQNSQGMPTRTQSHASARWLVPRHGRSGAPRRPSRCCRKLSTP
jgi:hypothetical protein